MLSPFDDYPLHQSPLPIAHAGTSDRNAYERYFFNGYDRDGQVFFAAALGVYPNREVIDAAFSVVHAGEQRSVHASARLGADRVRTAVGPIAVEVEVPMQRLRVTVDADDLGMRRRSWSSRRALPPSRRRPFGCSAGPRPVFDYTRLTQWGSLVGLDHGRRPRAHDRPRRRSSAPATVRGASVPSASRSAARPSHELPQFFWLWAPLHFDDRCAHFDVNEFADGRRWHQTGMIVPLLDADPSVERSPRPTASCSHATSATRSTGSRARGERRARRSSCSRGTARPNASSSSRS